MRREVNFYKTKSGKSPIEEFLDSVPSKAAQKIMWVLSLIEDVEMVPAQYFKKLVSTAEIWECRVKQGSNIYRIFGFMEGRELILTHGIIKKTQKTPAGEIEKAEIYREEYLKRRAMR